MLQRVKQMDRRKIKCILRIFRDRDVREKVNMLLRLATLVNTNKRRMFSIANCIGLGCRRKLCKVQYNCNV